MRREKPHSLAGSALRLGASLVEVDDPARPEAPTASSTSCAVAGCISCARLDEEDEVLDEEEEVAPPAPLLLPPLVPRARRSDVDDEPFEARLPNRPIKTAPRAYNLGADEAALHATLYRRWVSWVGEI